MQLILLLPVFLLSLLLLLLSSSQSPYTQDRSMRISAFSTDLQFECVDRWWRWGPAYFNPMCMETVHGLCRVSFYLFIRFLDVCTKTYCEKDRPCCVYNGAGVTSSCSLHCCVDTRLSGWWRVFDYVSRKWFKDTRLIGYQRDNLVSSNADCTRTAPHRLYMHAVCKGTNTMFQTVHECSMLKGPTFSQYVSGCTCMQHVLKGPPAFSQYVSECTCIQHALKGPTFSQYVSDSMKDQPSHNMFL